MCCTSDILLGFLAILFPPLPVWVKCGLCSADSLINILLCVLGYVPGLLHAWYVIAKFPESYDYERVPEDSEEGRVYVFVRSSGEQPRRKPHHQPPPPHGGMNYGTSAEASSSSAPAPAPASNHYDPAPPTYAEAVKGDNKIQTQE